MSPHSRFLAKMIGLSLCLLALTMLVNRDGALIAFAALARDSASLWVSGMVGMTAGVALVLSHNLWTGGVPTIVVTMVGWIILIKSVVALMVPQGFVEDLTGKVLTPPFLLADGVALLALGLYLTIAAYRNH